MKSFWKKLGGFLVAHWPTIVQVILEAQHQKQNQDGSSVDPQFVVSKRF